MSNPIKIPFILPNIPKKELEYTSDSEYRALFRKLSEMDISTIDIDPCIDEVTKDEILYDDNAVITLTSKIWEATKNNEDFCELYQLSAGAMFSTDLEIGIVVLFAYDYLRLFYPIIYEYSLHPNMDVDTHPNYDKLIRIFSKR